VSAPQKLRAAVASITEHGDGVYTVTLAPERTPPRFQPGQFLHLALDPYDPTGFWPESRGFSIASSPTRRDVVQLTYAVQGPFTARMRSELREGGHVWIKMPYGDFVIDAQDDIVLFAGGTGITAFSAFLTDLPATSTAAVTVAYGARTMRLLIYRDLVERCAERVPAFDAVFFAEDDADGATVDRGRVSVDVVWRRLRRPLDANFYVAGPPAMIQHVERELRGRHVAQEAIHIDAWE
jgi:ferredoxin-NADP reductase